jgi:hypothetical protein
VVVGGTGGVRTPLFGLSRLRSLAARTGRAGVPSSSRALGICEVCRMPVLANQIRTQRPGGGAYVHAQCADHLDRHLTSSHTTSPGAGERGVVEREAAACAVCGGGGIGRKCGWCRHQDRHQDRHLTSSQIREMQIRLSGREELARFNTSFLLAARAAAGGVSRSGGGGGEGGVPAADEVAESEEAELVVGGNGSVLSERCLAASGRRWLPRGRIDDAAAAAALRQVLG